MNITWKDITMNDKEEISWYYTQRRDSSNRGCEHTFANNVLWAPHYKTKYAIVEGMLVFISNEEAEFSVSFPVGNLNPKKTIDVLLQYFEEKGKKFRMHLVTAEEFQVLEELYPDTFQIEYDRDSADYIYESEKLITLSGKKLHSKRNFINRFKAEHDDWQYESITRENVQDCLTMAEEWCVLNGCRDDVEKQAEICVTIKALKDMEELNLKGGLLRLEGRVIAFSLGEEVCADTFVVHIEKAFSDVPGAYPMINQQFVEHEAASYQYINREEDTGAEGLRKAKLSYYPAMLWEKGIVTFK